jgi:hypothetical protein
VLTIIAIQQNADDVLGVAVRRSADDSRRIVLAPVVDEDKLELTAESVPDLEASLHESGQVGLLVVYGND